MKHSSALPLALTIAGSDSGGGAGIQADLKVFNALGAHGTTAITCLTSQNPKRVRSIQSAKPEILLNQLEAVFDELPPAAVKTGMLHNKRLIETVVDFFGRGKRPPLVVDPVMVATSGARLLKPSAIQVLQTQLLPLAALVTPNLDEAMILTCQRLSTPEHLRSAARSIHERFGCAVLLKGGHLKNLNEAVDIFWDGKTELMLTAPFVRGFSTHGTGCTYSAAITAYLAKGCSLSTAVKHAKQYVTQAIAGSKRIGRHWTLDAPSRNS